VLTNGFSACIHDEDGHITIPGFYDGVKDLPPDILAQWKKSQSLTPETFLKPIGLSSPGRRKGPPPDRAGVVAPDLRHQRHRRRLHRRRAPRP
jgi:hypothetical protein